MRASHFSPVTLPMCYFLYLASPLTLSEVRSMLPPRTVADLAGFVAQQALKTQHPDAQTVARVLTGRCSCDLMRPRQVDAREDERHLRERYRQLGVPRHLVITALERHRRGAGLRTPAGGWPKALAAFVAEHARNAGPTLYHLTFSPADDALGPVGSVRDISVGKVLAEPEAWLVEGSPALVSR